MRCGKAGGSATVEWNFCEADKTTLVMAAAHLLRSSPFERAEAANERRVLKIIRPVNRRWRLSRENNAQLPMKFAIISTLRHVTGEVHAGPKAPSCALLRGLLSVSTSALRISLRRG